MLMVAWQAHFYDRTVQNRGGAERSNHMPILKRDRSMGYAALHPSYVLLQSSGWNANPMLAIIMPRRIIADPVVITGDPRIDMSSRRKPGRLIKRASHNAHVRATSRLPE
jgi:hypothetical protein